MPIHIGSHNILAQVSTEPLWTTCQAESKLSGERVWFKILSQDLASDNEVAKRFHEGAQLNTSLKHPNILTWYEHGTDDGLHVAAVEHFNGKRLIDLLDDEQSLPLDRAVKIVSQIAKALQYAHIRGVLHGALSPYSIYLDKTDFVKVSDFGLINLIAYLLHKKSDKSVLPLAPYFSPEQAVSYSYLTGRSDIYSLGIIFYKILTGETPFNKKDVKSLLKAHRRSKVASPRIVVPSLPEDIEGIILRQLAKDPNDRYPNCTVFLYDLVPDYRQEVETEYAEDEWSISKWSAITSRLADVIPERLRVFSPTLVGSRRRLALAFLSISVLVVIVALVILLSGLGRKSTEEDMYAYYDWMDEQKREEKSDSVAAQTAVNLPDLDDLNQSPPKIVTKIKEQRRPPREQKSSFVEEKSAESTAPDISTPKEPPLTTSIVDQASLAEYGDLLIYTTTDSEYTDASVYLDDELVGQTSVIEPLRIPQVSTHQTHVVRVIKPGYRDAQSAVEVTTDRENKITLNLTPLVDAMKRFYFRPVSFADRIIINNQLPSRPLPCEVDLAVGKHNFRYLDSQTGFSWDTQLVLDLNSPEEIKFDAQQVGSGRLSVVLGNSGQFGYAYVQLDGENTLNKTTPYRANVPVGRHSVKIVRQGFTCVPEDTTIFIGMGEETNVVFNLIPR